MNNNSSHPITRLDLRDALDRRGAQHPATDANPQRTRQQVIRDMMAVCDSASTCSHRRQAADRDPDIIRDLPVQPHNGLTLGDGTTPFHRAPVGMLPRPGMLISFEAGLKAAGEKMRGAFRHYD